MLVTTKKKHQICSIFVDYQNVGPIMIDVLLRQSKLQTNDCGGKKQCIQLVSLSYKRVCSVMFKCA